MKSAASLVIVFFAVLLSACQTGGTLSTNSTAPQAAFETRPAIYAPPQVQPTSLAGGPSTEINGAPAIHAQCYIMVDPHSGRVISAHNADTLHAVASTQKILTALVVLDDGGLDKTVRISGSDVAVEPTKLGVRPGDTYSRRDLMTAFLVKSANDVANALARDCAGSISAFADRMNAKARSLGAYNSYFCNPHGLSCGGQHSTARDMARIGMAAYHSAFLRDVVRRKYYGFRFANGHSTTLENTNELLGRMAECDGMKTGYTGPAGRCLISTAHRGSRDVLLVQLGSRTSFIFNDAATMMRWGLGR